MTAGGVAVFYSVLALQSFVTFHNNSNLPCVFGIKVRCPVTEYLLVPRIQIAIDQ